LLVVYNFFPLYANARLSHITDFDKVVVMGDGMILEVGSPAQLLATDDNHYYEVEVEGDIDRKIGATYNSAKYGSDGGGRGVGGKRGGGGRERGGSGVGGNGSILRSLILSQQRSSLNHSDRTRLRGAASAAAYADASTTTAL
jgi:hypothetical protein